jgi:hypothetical protein
MIGPSVASPPFLVATRFRYMFEFSEAGFVMSDEPENLILAMLRRLDDKVDSLGLDLRDVKHRLTAVEISVANLAATEASHYANVALRVDRVDDRLERIEKRLDLVEPA